MNEKFDKFLYTTDSKSQIIDHTPEIAPFGYRDFFSDEGEDTFSLQVNSIISSWINKNRRYINESLINAATHKLSLFLSELGAQYYNNRDIIEIDSFIDNSIVIRFQYHKDIKLNLYYGDDIMFDDDSEECYLSYKFQGVRTVESNNISTIVPILKKLLS